jgi:antitoxin MazE
MQTQIVQIGNSLGLRLPKSVLASLHLERAAHLSIQTRGDSIVLRPIKKPRDTWSSAFAADPAAEVENLWGELPLDEAWDA